MHRRKPLLLPPRCHCLSRGSSGRAGVVACGGGSGSSSSGGSGTILFLVCCHNPPPLCFVLCLSASSFPISLLAALSAGCRSPAFNVQWLVVICSEVNTLWWRGRAHVRSPDDAPPVPSSPCTQQHPRGLVRSGGRRRTQGGIARRHPRPFGGFGG